MSERCRFCGCSLDAPAPASDAGCPPCPGPHELAEGPGPPFDAATTFAAQAFALRMYANLDTSRPESELYHALAWGFELIADELGGPPAPSAAVACLRSHRICGNDVCPYCRPSMELRAILAPLFQSLRGLGLRRT